MGLGDELMTIGLAEETNRKTGFRVAVVDRDGNPRWSEVWENHPAIATVAEAKSGGVAKLTSCAGERAYIAGWSEWHGRPRLIFSGWRIRDHAGRLHFTDAEAGAGEFYRKMTGRYAVIEPNINQAASSNKLWSWEKYQAIVDMNPNVRFVQMGPRGTRLLRGVKHCETQTFRSACMILSRADAYVGPEGGLHIAAGLLRIPAVVIFGGFGSIEATGFPWHHNVELQDPETPCGRWAACDHCERAMSWISPTHVNRELQGALRKEKSECRH